jgi:cytochrome c biogenesis protein CcmG, thiol:disulfide interchange protein DsbE
MKKLTLLLTMSLVVTACGGGGDAASDSVAFGDVTVEGSIVPFENPTADPAVGSPAPRVSGVDRTGAPVQLSPGTNPTLVLFMAHWCPHCQADLPRMVEWLEANPDRLGIDVVAIATGSQQTSPNFPPGPWLEREGWDQPHIMDDQNGTAARAFGLTSYPFWVAIDAEGNVLGRTAGELGPGQIDQLMQGIAST